MYSGVAVASKLGAWGLVLGVNAEVLLPRLSGSVCCTNCCCARLLAVMLADRLRCGTRDCLAGVLRKVCHQQQPPSHT